jgi:hypothetical protein
MLYKIKKSMKNEIGKDNYQLTINESKRKYKTNEL